MKTKSGFNLRVVVGENVIVAEGKENIDFNSIIRLNETAATIWKAVQGKDFEVKDMVDALMAEYEVDKATATKDCEMLAKNWGEAGMLEGVEAKVEKPTITNKPKATAPEKPAVKEEKKESFLKKITRKISSIFK